MSSTHGYLDGMKPWHFIAGIILIIILGIILTSCGPCSDELHSSTIPSGTEVQYMGDCNCTVVNSRPVWTLIHCKDDLKQITELEVKTETLKICE